jgi:hypothetical protein
MSDLESAERLALMTHSDAFGQNFVPVKFCHEELLCMSKLSGILTGSRDFKQQPVN